MANEPIECRTVFISDLHLGATGSKTEAIQDFLYHVECEKLYLVGDIIDGWVTRQKRWKQEHSNVIRTLLGKAKRGCQVYYTPGNHDAFMRRMNGSDMGFIEFDHSFIHRMVDGREFLVVHGDLFDPTCVKHSWIAWVAAWMYEYLQVFNQRVNRGRAAKNRRGWDFASKIKRFTKGMTSGKEKFDDILSEHAREQGFEGVVCGHVHRPVIRKDPDGFVYINTGDWVEHATAVIEEFDGSVRLVHWDMPDPATNTNRKGLSRQQRKVVVRRARKE